MSGAHEDVLDVLRRYGDGIYDGDCDKLRTVFDPAAMLAGEVRGAPYRKSLAAYLDLVAARRSPRQLGEPYGFTVMSVEVTHEIALARMRCIMLGHDYVDYLALVREQGAWRIVSKVFTDVGAREPAFSRT